MSNLQHLGWDDTHPNEWRDGQTCNECQLHIAKKRKKLYNRPNVHFGMVPGGNTGETWRVDYEKQFAKDMEKYKGAKDNGLQPNQVSVAAVEKAEAKAELFDKIETEAVPLG
jgi:hypothetical protein